MANALKIALVKREQTLADVSRSLGIGYDRLTKISAGLRKPRPEEAKAISEMLGCPVSELFPEVRSVREAK